MMVAIPHFFLYFGFDKYGFESIAVIAVEIFFVLSGFVLAPQIISIIQNYSWQSLKIFLIRRWMRTLPPFIIALILISALTDNLGTIEFWRYIFYVQNLFHQHNSFDYFSIAWSLSVEEWFYIAFPLALVFIVNKQSKSSCNYVLAACIFILIITVLRTVFGDSADWGASVRRVVLFRIDSIAYGFLLYVYTKNRPPSQPGNIVLGLTLSTIAIILALKNSDEYYLAQILYPIISAFFGSYMILMALVLNDIVSPYKKVAEMLGITSYAIYLYHFLIIYMLSIFILPIWLNFTLFIVFTGCLSTISAYWFERPILAMRPPLMAKGKV